MGRSVSTWCMQPMTIMEEGPRQLYRMFTAQWLHGGILHLAMNMMATAPLLGIFEATHGTVKTFWFVIFIGWCCSAVQLIVALVCAIVQFGGPMLECGVGLSTVLFSLSMLRGLEAPEGATQSVFGMFTVSAKWYPLVMAALIQVIMPRISWSGHGAGLLMGFLWFHGLKRFSPSARFIASLDGADCLKGLNSRDSWISGPSTGSLDTTASGDWSGFWTRMRTSMSPSASSGNGSSPWSESSQLVGTGRKLGHGPRGDPPAAAERV